MSLLPLSFSFLLLLLPLSLPAPSDLFTNPYLDLSSMIFKCPNSHSSLKRRICGVEAGKVVNVFSICAEGEICAKTRVNGELMTCVKKIKTLPEGKRCGLDQDCRTQNCLDKKCTAKSQGSSCSSDAECGKGNGCNENKCVPLIKEVGQPCSNTNKCGFGMLCNNEKCVKFGTIENGNQTIDEILCKSGMAYNNICVSVSEEHSCAKEGQTIDIKFKEFPSAETVNCTQFSSEDGQANNYHDYYGLRTTLFNNYIEEFNKVDLDSLYDREDLDVKSDGAGLGKWKVKEKFLVYKHFGYLKEMGLIDADGEVRNEKEREYDFFIKQAAGERMKGIISGLGAFIIFIGLF